MKKKILFTTLAAVGLLALGACSSSSESMSDEIATYKGGSITVEDYYDEIKLSSTNTSTLQNLIIFTVFEEVYGDDVSDDDVQDRYDEIAASYSDFDSQLETYGYTEETYKAALKQNLAFEAGLKANAEVTDEDLETAWESFHPEVEAQIISVTDEDTANSIVDQLNNGGDFEELATANSTNSTIDFTFDSTSTDVPDEVKTAAFELANDQVSSVISVTDSSTYTTYYYIVKMIATSDKGDDMSEYEDTLKEVALDTITADQTFRTETIAKVLQDANVTIKDDDFSSLLSSYLTTTSSSTSGSAATSSSSEATSDSSTAESSTAESSTTESSTTESSTTESSSAAE